MAYKVLVIEDNTDCRELFATIIRHLGFHVIEADDGEVGVQKALAEKPDLIFMDLGMPSMSGIEATSCLRESAVTKHIPIIICTAWMAQNHREAALRMVESVGGLALDVTAASLAPALLETYLRVKERGLL